MTVNAGRKERGAKAPPPPAPVVEAPKETPKPAPAPVAPALPMHRRNIINQSYGVVRPDDNAYLPKARAYREVYP